MVDRKNHNSMLFLTTLGVYLSLVLVGGAAPQVFAHGALTRNFEISDEIEVADDLEKRPDPAFAESDTANGPTTQILDVSDSVNDLVRSITRSRPLSLFAPSDETVDLPRPLGSLSGVDTNKSFRCDHCATILRLPRASLDPLSVHAM